jgi:hypothetical protein
MSMDRWGAAALILGSVAYIALMAVHPSHVGPPVLGHLSLSALVHGTALFVLPILAFGFTMLAGRLGLDRPLPALGLSFYAFSAVTVMLAGTMSGLVIPEIVEAAHDPPHGAPADALRGQLQWLTNYTVWLNRSFAQVHVGLFSVAMILWSLAWPTRGIADWVVRILGLAVGAGILAWQIPGTLELEARHGALVVTLLHSLWTIMAASLLLRERG